MARNWLEPPEWWKRHKPLRWMLVFAILLFAYAKFDDWRDRRATETPRAASTEQAPPASAAGPEEVAPPPAPPAEPAPAVAAKAKPPVPPVVEAEAAPPASPAETVPPPDPMARYTQVETQRVTLMTQRSYDSVEAVTEILQKSGYSGELTTQERRSRRNYPPHRLDTLELAEFKHLGSVGKLRLEFFNDRLYEAYFQPAKAGDYLYKLRKKQRLKRDQSGRTEHVQGHLRIASNIDLAESDVGKALKVAPFILWQDLRLIQQLKDWGPIR
ncbi:MAG: hypothetical protein ACRETN_08345 [Nevskiales bacterium]